MVKLSIILPVYNVREYLRQCVDSILSQPYNDFEVIIVDDGSTDGSGKICDEYSLCDKRINVFHKPNGGLSSARNYGLAQHKGCYISFVDSDDFLVGDYYSKAIRQLDDNDLLDIVCLQYAKVYEDGSIMKSFNGEDQLYIKGKDKSFLQQFCSKDAFAGVKIYRSSIFEAIKYPEGQIIEDLYIVPDLFERVRSFSIVTMDGYYAYRQRATSICHAKHTPKMLSDIALAYARMIQLYKDNERSGYIKILATYSSGYLNCMVLFPDHDYSRLSTLYSQFDYAYSEILSASASMSQKIKLLMLKLFGYRGMLRFYKFIYKMKHSC